MLRPTLPSDNKSTNSRLYVIFCRIRPENYIQTKMGAEELGQEDFSGVADVLGELCDDRFDAIELTLAAQEMGETNPGGLAIEIVIEVEEVSLEQ